MRTVNRIIIILASFLLVFSCKNDSGTQHSPVGIENVQGTWEVIKATRNNRVANTFSNAEFVITDSTFSCNFLDNTQSFPYSFDGKRINVLNPSENSYSVRLLTPDTLLLAVEIKNFDFKFTSVKKAQND